MASVVILGGGTAGLSLGWHLSKNGFSDFILFEKESIPEGLARSEVNSSLRLDLCSRPLSLAEGYAKDLLTQLLPNRLAALERNEWIRWRDIDVRIPVETSLSALPVEDAKDCLLGFIEAQQGGAGHPANARSVGTLEDWLISSYGRGIATRFLVPFHEKFWTVHPGELTSRRTGGLSAPASLDEVVAGALNGQSAGSRKRAEPRYAIAGGTGTLCEIFAAAIPDLQTSSEASEVDLDERRIRFRTGGEHRYERLFCSLPLPGLGRLLKPLPAGIREAFEKLRHASVLNIILAVERRVTEKHSIDFPDPEISFYRLTFPSNFQGAMPNGVHPISVETAYAPHRPLDRERAVETVEKDLVKAGLLDPADRIVSRQVFDIEYGRALPVRGYAEAVARVREFLEERDVYIFGRSGAWDNTGIEEAIVNGKKIAEEVVRSQSQSYAPRMPEQAPLVSIVIPVYNEEKVLESFTGEIVEAVGKLGIPYELILAENGSRDRTAEIANRLAALHRRIRAVHYPEPNYGKALALGVLNAAGDYVVCFEIDFWDAEFVEISRVLLKKYDAVIGSKQAPGARDRRPWIRRMITFCFNLFLKFAFGFQGTDTHGIKSFRREKAASIVGACQTGKDIFATELVLRMQRAGLYMCELPLEIEEKRAPSINLLKRVPSTIRNLITLWKVTRKLRPADQRMLEPAPKVTVDP